jgi:hypothetical protein
MTFTQRLSLIVLVAAIAGGAWYLYDPPWTARVTSGMRDWEEDPPGTRFRWTDGHGAFFVPSAATTMTLPIKAWFPGPNGEPVRVTVAVDDRWLADIVVRNPQEWESTTLPLPRRLTRRRYRRIDLRVSRTMKQFNLGVAVGDVRLTYPSPLP